VPEEKIFEETKIKLRLKVDKGKVNEQTAEFTLLVEGQSHSTHTANLEGSAFSWPTTAPKIDDPKVSKWPYALKYQVKHDGTTYNPNEEWEVWPKTLDLEPKGNDGPAQLKLLQKDKVVSAPPKIEKDATGTGTLKLAAVSTVQAAFPWKVKSGGITDAGRKRTVELEKVAFQAKFAKPDKGTEAGKPIEQLVNVATGSSTGQEGQDGKGEVVHCEVKVSGMKSSQYADAEGNLVYIKATFSNKTKRDDSTFPRKLEADDVDDTDPDVQKGTAKLDKKGVARFALHLGLAGSEKCKVEIGSTDACSDDTKYFETWRQLHFQISHPKTATKPAPDDFVTSYKEIKMKMVEEPVGSISSGGGPKGAWIAGADVETGLGRKVLIIGTHNEKDFHKLSFRNKNDAKYAHFLMCDFQYDFGTAASHDFEIEAKHLIGGGPDAAFDVRTFEADKKLGLLPTSVKDGKDAIRELSYSVDANGHQGKITKYKVDYAGNTAVGGKVTFTLPKEAAKDYDDGETVKITWQAHLAKGPYNGSSTNNLLLIAMRNSSGERAVDGLNQTMVHEIGHALGMCADGIVIPGIADPKTEHGRSYTARGHTGGHCAKGIGDADYGDDTILLSNKPGTCVMYGAGGSSRKRSYCDLCQKLLFPAALGEYFLATLT
jgi:hypothetical protein